MSSVRSIPEASARIAKAWEKHNERMRALQAVFKGALQETKFWNPDVLAVWRACPAACVAAMEYLKQAETSGERPWWWS